MVFKGILYSLTKKANGDEEEIEGVGDDELSPNDEESILKIIKNTPNLDDDDFHSLVENKGIEPHEAEEVVYDIAHTLLNKGGEEKIPGGLAEGIKSSLFNKTQLRMGKEVEKEHTTDPAKAKEITKDHLVEDPKYYTHLKEMEDKYSKKEHEKDAALRNYLTNFFRL